MMLKVGFLCAKNTLCAANAVYLVVGVSLMAVAGYGKSFGIVWSLSIISVVMVVGVFLIFISMLGIFGALRQNQIVLFTYILAMMLVFFFQFTVSCSCLALGREKQEKLLSVSWEMMSDETRRSLEQQLDCCGLMNSAEKLHVFRTDVKVCTAACKTTAHCFTCGDLMLHHAAETLRVLGGVGLFCSFSQLVTVWLAVQYRNQKNPQISSTTSS
ncbi:tetraspanin-31-B-like isoform X1 [Ictalurus furcatus]|uniref:tetraspanin-31-B-like isoform X1 n=1 Tax=Ictalurus furcatus TaxID=66913 RepID=UPI0023503F04|nr:tetraspanin-31-B-like isoform X1 [Ictalurus furcatus]